MVFYFTCSDPRYIIYMGRDKFENESLIAYGWPEDLWFHVDGHSSAHVYLRLPKEQTIDDVPHAIVVECAQLTKLNSIAGCKLNNIKIVYCMWSNLRKAGDMATGQIGYHDRSACKYITIEKRINEIVNRLNKTKEEKHNNPAELYDLRKARERKEVDAGKQASREVHRNLALERDMERQRLATRVETVYGFENVDEEELERNDAEQMARIMESMANRSRTKRGSGVSDADLCSDLFGDLAERPEREAEEGELDVVDDGPIELTPEELLKKAALMDVGSAGGQPSGAGLAALVEVAHVRKAAAEAKARAKASEKAVARQGEEAKAAAAKPSVQAEACAKANAAREEAAVRLAREAAPEEENRSAQEEEAMVLQSIFGEDECEVVEGAHELKLAVSGDDRAGAERRVTLHLRMPAEYPSHVPPECYRLEGVETDDFAYVQDALALLYFGNDIDPNSVCVMQWAEWLRDEYIANLTKCGGGVDPPKPTAGAAGAVKVRREDWMSFSMARGGAER